MAFVEEYRISLPEISISILQKFFPKKADIIGRNVDVLKSILTNLIGIRVFR